MKITQITSENTVSEAPGNTGIGNLVRKGAAKVAGALGGTAGKGFAAGVQGGLDADAKMKDIFTKWRAYLGTQGGNAKAPEAQDLIDFFKKEKLPMPTPAPQGTMSSAQVDAIITKAAKDSFKPGADAQGGGGQTTPGGAQPQGGGAGAPTGGTTGGGAGGQVPADIQKAVDSLNAQQRQELVKLL
tara:strand:+ start:34 stop:591 length:558 start_codon:yes stop_codon:yes gene_type:complete